MPDPPLDWPGSLSLAQRPDGAGNKSSARPSTSALSPPPSPTPIACTPSPTSSTTLPATMIASSPAPPVHKRPRGLWKGRREAALHAHLEKASRSHAHDDLEHLASASTYSFDSYYDDLDDDRASSSSYYSRPTAAKRRRISPSDDETIWHHSPDSRSLTPDFDDDVPCFPAQIAAATSPTDYLRPPMEHLFKPDRFASINRQDKGKPPLQFTSDLEEWESLKGLFARAYQSYEAEDVTESLPLLRSVIRACHLFLLAHPDPCIVFVEPHLSRDSRSPDIMTPAEERLLRDWATEPYDPTRRPTLPHLPSSSSTTQLHLHPHPHPAPKPAPKPTDPPTAFHAIFGTALYLMGTLVAADASLALPDEPNSASTYWLAALDVFETGENMPAVIHGRRERPEDWRMAVSWGRTLVCLAEEKLTHAAQLHRAHGERPAATPNPAIDLANGWCAYQPSAGPFSATEPRWPASSPFHAVAVARPPVTRRMSLFRASAHDVMVLAMDQFARGIFHMPHPHYPHTHNPTGLQLDTPFVDGRGFAGAYSARRGPANTPPISRSMSRAPTSQEGSTTLPFSRPKELFTIASEILGVAERLARSTQREYWASQADSVFNQMKMEADMDVSRGAVNAARGRCWLVVGEARAEELEGALERGEASVLWSAEAEDAREGLAMAVTFFERAKGTAKGRWRYGGDEVGELSPLLAEAILTLANLTADEGRREELYARAQMEAGDVDLGLDPIDPPSPSRSPSDLAPDTPAAQAAQATRETAEDTHAAGMGGEAAARMVAGTQPEMAPSPRAQTPNEVQEGAGEAEQGRALAGLSESALAVLSGSALAVLSGSANARSGTGGAAVGRGQKRRRVSSVSEKTRRERVAKDADERMDVS